MPDVEYCMPPPVQWRFQHMLFHCDLELWPFDLKVYCVHLCPVVHRWCKFGENVSNILQDIVLTMFRDAHTDARTNGTDEQAKNSIRFRPHYVGGGIIMSKSRKLITKQIWEPWVQRITFTAETDAALRRAVAAGRTDRHTDADDHNTFPLAKRRGEGNELVLGKKRTRCPKK